MINKLFKIKNIRNISHFNYKNIINDTINKNNSNYIV